MKFTRKEYDSQDGMMTSIWGPAMWHFLHTMSFNYPMNPSSDQKEHYRAFIINMVNILPCGKCRTNLIKNFQVLPLTDHHLSSRSHFSRYIYDLHNIINKMLCKNYTITYVDVRNKYEKFRARCSAVKKQNEEQQFCKTKKKRKMKNSKDDEKGCIVPNIGIKQKCILRIVPDSVKCKTFS